MRLARVLGYRDRGGDSALDRFERDYRRNQGDVRAIHEQLFFAPILETLAGAGPSHTGRGRGAPRRVRLPRRARRRGPRCASSRRASPAGRASCSSCSRSCSSGCRATPDPDLGLLQLRRLAEGPAALGSLGQELPRFARRGGAGDAACSDRAGWSGDALRRHPEFVETLGDDAVHGRERSLRRAGRRGAPRRSTGAAIPSSAGRGCAASSAASSCASRHATCSASPPIESTGRELAGLADACVEPRRSTRSSPRSRSR